MAEDYFEFKQFNVRQDKCAMKVGTDGVLLGAWIRAEKNLRILDIGAGTGLISLMLAQRTSGEIDAVEMERHAYQQSIENFASSPWSNRLTCVHKSIQEFVGLNKVRYDLIVSNPPFFKTGARSADIKRANARHADSLTLKQLVIIVAELLKSTGRFGIVLPFTSRIEFIKCISQNGLWIIREARVRPLPNQEYVRVLLEVGRNNDANYVVEEIIIEAGKRHDYAKTFTHYTKDFYLEQKMQ